MFPDMSAALDAASERNRALVRAAYHKFRWPEMQRLLEHLGFVLAAQGVSDLGAIYYYQGNTGYPLPLYSPFTKADYEWPHESVSILMGHCHDLIEHYAKDHPAGDAKLAEEVW